MCIHASLKTVRGDEIEQTFISPLNLVSVRLVEAENSDWRQIESSWDYTETRPSVNNKNI